MTIQQQVSKDQDGKDSQRRSP